MYYTRFLIILTFLASGCSTAPVNDQPDAPADAPSQQARDAAETINIYRSAISSLNSNHLDQAEMQFLKVIKHQSDLAGPWANLGLLYLKKQQPDKAREHVQKALEKNPKFAQAHHLLAYLETQAGNIIKARDHYLQAVEYKPDYGLAHYNLALLYDTYFQDLRKAVRHYERYLTIIDHEDEKTTNWVKELKRNLKRQSS